MTRAKQENIKLQNALQNKVFGRTAPNGKLYLIDTEEVKIFKQLTFIFNESSNAYEADLSILDQRNRSPFEKRYYIQTRVTPELIALGARLGISFDQEFTNISKLVVSDPVSIDALEKAGLVAEQVKSEITSLALPTNMLNQNPPTTAVIITEDDKKNPEQLKIISAFFALQNLIKELYNIDIIGELNYYAGTDVLCEAPLVIRAKFKYEFLSAEPLLNLLDSLSNSFACIPDEHNERNYDFRTALSEDDCKSIIALLGDKLTAKIEAAARGVEEKNINALFKAAFGYDVSPIIDPEKKQVRLFFTLDKDLQKVRKELNAYTDNSISDFRGSDFLGNSWINLIFPLEKLGSVKIGLKLSAGLFLPTEPVGPYSGGFMNKC